MWSNVKTVFRSLVHAKGLINDVHFFAAWLASRAWEIRSVSEAVTVLQDAGSARHKWHETGIIMAPDGATLPRCADRRDTRVLSPNVATRRTFPKCQNALVPALWALRETTWSGVIILRAVALWNSLTFPWHFPDYVRQTYPSCPYPRVI